MQTDPAKLAAEIRAIDFANDPMGVIYDLFVENAESIADMLTELAEHRRVTGRILNPGEPVKARPNPILDDDYESVPLKPAGSVRVRYVRGDVSESLGKEG